MFSSAPLYFNSDFIQNKFLGAIADEVSCIYQYDSKIA